MMDNPQRPRRRRWHSCHRAQYSLVFLLLAASAPRQTLSFTGCCEAFPRPPTRNVPWRRPVLVLTSQWQANHNHNQQQQQKQQKRGDLALMNDGNNGSVQDTGEEGDAPLSGHDAPSSPTLPDTQAQPPPQLSPPPQLPPKWKLALAYVGFVSFWPLLAGLQIYFRTHEFDVDTYLTIKGLLGEGDGTLGSPSTIMDDHGTLGGSIRELPPLSPAERLVDSLFGPSPANDGW